MYMARNFIGCRYTSVKNKLNTQERTYHFASYHLQALEAKHVNECRWSTILFRREKTLLNKQAVLVDSCFGGLSGHLVFLYYFGQLSYGK